MRETKIISLLVLLFLWNNSIAQCDFVNDITGLSLSVPPAGDAADPSLYTTVFVLVDSEGEIVATSNTPDFIGLDADLYYLYSVNYENTETASIVPLLAAGELFSDLQAYAGCIDISDAYGDCSISVCDEISVVENSILVNPATGVATTGHQNDYCLVCDGVVQATNSTGTFDLSLYPLAAAGGNCQVVSVNYTQQLTAPASVGDVWSTVASGNCDLTICWEYLARDLDITSVLSVSLTEFEGTAERNFNQLIWETSSETNCSHFELLRSEDGLNFEKVYEVSGQGTTTESHEYGFQDYSITKDLYYYQLKDVDFDGAFDMSQLIAVSRSGSVSNEMKVYPVPAKDLVNVLFEADQVGKAVVELRSVDGKLILSKEINCQAGVNSLNLNLTHLSQGIYQLSTYLMSEDKMLKASIVK